jgi:predicted dienelactone hydrolase
MELQFGSQAPARTAEPAKIRDDARIVDAMRSLFALCALAVSSLALAMSANPPAMSARGSYRVGVKTVNAVDSSRNRNFTLEVWYPASVGADAERTTYRSTVGATPYALPGRAARDAPMLEGKFPLLVYSHGQPGSRLQTLYLLEHLASQGFVVAGVDHTGSIYADVTQQSYATGLVDRPLDILAAIGTAGKAISSADQNNVGLLGYSYGGYSALSAAGIGLDGANLRAYCQRSNNEGPCFLLPFFASLETARGPNTKPDPRVKAVFVMAPYGAPWLSPKALEAMRVPLFVGIGSEDRVATPNRDALEVYKRSGSSAKYLLTLEGARHNPWVVCPPDIKVNAQDFERCSEPAWDHAVSHALTQHFATAFFGLHLQGKTALESYLTPALEGVSDKARVKLETKK